MEEASKDFLFEELANLQHEYAELESVIFEELSLDPVTIERIRKRKSWVKERLDTIRSSLYPEVIA